MDLGGAWRATVADEHLRRVWSADDFDDTSWPSLSVPGHWRSAPGFSASDGPLLYRRQFDHPRPDAGQRHWLVFDGIFYQGDVWFDGAYLGATEGYFFPHTFEVTEHLAGRDDHTLAVEVTCTPPRDPTARRNLTGVFQHGPGVDPNWNPGGLWRPLRLETSGSVRLRDLQVLCAEATPRRASVSVVAVLDSAEARSVVVRSTVGDADRELVQPVAAGRNWVEWTVTIDDPPLWWPWALGDQPMVDVAVDVVVDDALSDRRTLRTGLRSVELRNWICSVNGERLFLKGTNQGPTRTALAEATPEEIAHDVHLAVDAGLDLMRVHAHIARPELYHAADHAGLLLWQDLPLFGSYARGIRREAARQARAAVQYLGHHPSIAMWCGHDEPAGGEHSRDRPVTGRETTASAATAMNVRGQQLPTWNRSVLDRSVKRALEKADATRAVIAHSGVLPHLPQLDGTDSHLWFGWHWGEEHLLSRVCASLPRLVRFVSKFGAQAVPDDADFCEPERWPDLDWGRLEQRHGLQKDAFDRHVPTSEHTTFGSSTAPPVGSPSSASPTVRPG
jgi:beta-mannosidase